MLFIAAIIVFVASFIRGISGFGFALIATPLLTFVYPAKSVVIMNIILSAATNIVVLVQMRKHVDSKRLIFMCLGSLFGTPLGAFALSRLDPATVKVIIAACAIPFAVLLLLGHSRHFERDRLGCSVAGFIGGIAGASTSLGGPPVVLFLLNQGLPAQRFVGTLAAYFLFINLTSITAFSSLGMLTSDLLTKVVILLPVLFIGTQAGIWVLPRIKAAVFRRLATSVVCASAVGVIVSVFVKL